MSLKSVPNPPDPRPAWEKPVIPIRKDGKDKDSEVIGTRISKAHGRMIDELIASRSRPELKTRSDYLQMAITLADDYLLRSPTTSPEIKKMLRRDARNKEMAARQNYYDEMTTKLGALDIEMKKCLDSFQAIAQPQRFASALADLHYWLHDLDDDEMKEEAIRLWMKWSSVAKADSTFLTKIAKTNSSMVGLLGKTQNSTSSSTASAKSGERKSSSKTSAPDWNGSSED